MISRSLAPSSASFAEAALRKPCAEQCVRPAIKDVGKIEYNLVCLSCVFNISAYTEIFGHLELAALVDHLPSPNNYPGACSLCNSIFSNPEISQRIMAVIAEYETDQLLNMKSILSQRFGEEEVAHLFDLIGSRATGVS